MAAHLEIEWDKLFYLPQTKLHVTRKQGIRYKTFSEVNFMYSLILAGLLQIKISYHLIILGRITKLNISNGAFFHWKISSQWHWNPLLAEKNMCIFLIFWKRLKYDHLILIHVLLIHQFWKSQNESRILWLTRDEVRIEFRTKESLFVAYCQYLINTGAVFKHKHRKSLCLTRV